MIRGGTEGRVRKLRIKNLEFGIRDECGIRNERGIRNKRGVRDELGRRAAFQIPNS